MKPGDLVKLSDRFASFPYARDELHGAVGLIIRIEKDEGLHERAQVIFNGQIEGHFSDTLQKL